MSIRRVVPDIGSDHLDESRQRDESWSVRRFFLLDPNDVVINVMSHRPGAPPDH